MTVACVGRLRLTVGDVSVAVAARIEGASQGAPKVSFVVMMCPFFWFWIYGNTESRLVLKKCAK